MFETFKATIRTDLEEFLTTRKMRRAIELSQRTGQHFNHNEYPMFFTGRLDARLVLIHLNPKHANNTAPTYTGSLWLNSFDTYFTYHQQFGKMLYGSTSARTHKSPFDHKQIRFLTPFDALPFVAERTRDDRFTNLERVVDEKLQLELIPYSSDNFTTKGFTPSLLAPHVERVLDVISACSREYVLFCGKIFEAFFDHHIRNTHAFHLRKNDGRLTQNKARFSNIQFTFNGKIIRAGLAHSFAQQGIPMAAYGHQCKLLYEA